MLPLGDEFLSGSCEVLSSTEPWSDDYYTFNVEAAMHSVGFEHLVASNPQHRTMARAQTMSFANIAFLK